MTVVTGWPGVLGLRWSVGDDGSSGGESSALISLESMVLRTRNDLQEMVRVPWAAPAGEDSGRVPNHVPSDLDTDLPREIERPILDRQVICSVLWGTPCMQQCP